MDIWYSHYNTGKSVVRCIQLLVFLFYFDGYRLFPSPCTHRNFPTPTHANNPSAHTNSPTPPLHTLILMSSCEGQIGMGERGHKAPIEEIRQPICQPQWRITTVTYIHRGTGDTVSKVIIWSMSNVIFIGCKIKKTKVLKLQFRMFILKTR